MQQCRNVAHCHPQVLSATSIRLRVNSMADCLDQSRGRAAPDARGLIAVADRLMYVGKKTGRNRVITVEEIGNLSAFPEFEDRLVVERPSFGIELQHRPAQHGQVVPATPAVSLCLSSVSGYCSVPHHHGRSETGTARHRCLMSLLLSQ